MALSPMMIKLIHIGKSKLGLDDDTYRAMLRGFGAETSKDPKLQPKDWREIMAKFASMGFRPETPGTARGGTGRQVKAIRKMAAAHGVCAKRLRGIVKHVTGKEDIKWCDSRDLSKVYQAMKRWRWDAAGRQPQGTGPSAGTPSASP